MQRIQPALLLAEDLPAIGGREWLITMAAAAKVDLLHLDFVGAPLAPCFWSGFFATASLWL
jgi:hypothetical protein